MIMFAIAAAAAFSDPSAFDEAAGDWRLKGRYEAFDNSMGCTLSIASPPDRIVAYRDGAMIKFSGLTVSDGASYTVDDGKPRPVIADLTQEGGLSEAAGRSLLAGKIVPIPFARLVGGKTLQIQPGKGGAAVAFGISGLSGALSAGETHGCESYRPPAKD
jgi:hypothetical protein